jgi:GT2 family glycosyltransferase/glycosyltransferase involved in cell wall biosynthesis
MSRNARKKLDVEVVTREESPGRDDKRVVAVLGMHRGGTSAVTRGLSCLGVRLGEDLLQGSDEQNPRGFFEDEPLLEISDQVLTALGIRWDSTGVIAQNDWKKPEIDRLRIEAAENIERRFGSTPIWGFKNPRSPRLLPFWQSVFALVERSDSYVITLRNPLSVARSLKARNGFSERRSYLLWLIHLVQSVTRTKGRSRVCVDYDQLLRDPENQIARVATALDLASPSSSDLESYADEFLTKELRHSQFDDQAVKMDPELSELGRRAYGILARWSRDEAGVESKVDSAMRQIERRLVELSPVFAELDVVDRELSDERESLSRATKKVAEGQRARAAIEERAASLDQRARDLEQARNDLAQANTALGTSNKALQEEQERLRETLRARENEIVERDELVVEIRREADERLRASVDRGLEIEARYQELLVELDEIRALRMGDLERLTAQLDIESDRARQLADQNERLTDELDHERRRFEQELVAHDAEARRVLSAREHDLADQLREASDARGAFTNDVRAWAVAGIGRAAETIRENAEAARMTRTWRAARQLQRVIDRLRLRRHHDGLEHVIELARRFEHRSQGIDPDIRDLASDAATLSIAVREVLSGEILSSLQWAARSGRRLIGLHVESGPTQHLLEEAIELSYFLNRWTSSPFASWGRAAIDESPRSQDSDRASVVDVVVPVYGAREQTARCLESLLRAENSTPFDVVVIDDGNRDRKLLQLLQEYASRGQITLIRSEQNLGFTHSVNTGMSRNPDRDVVLLNSDTRVSDRWLDRLRAAVQSDWKIATATPFSNSAEICSWPRQHGSSTGPTPTPAPDREELDRLNEIVSEIHSGRSLTIPTAVGFCVYVTRESIREIGMFDADAFGRGYGEENDFSMRARAAGYRHVLAADVYVAHEGSASFGSEKAARIALATKMMSLRHPAYSSEVASFIAADPVKPLRRLIEARATVDSARRNFLMVCHDRGGGTRRHVEALSSALAAEGVGSIFLYPTTSGRLRVAQTIDGLGGSDDMLFDASAEMESLAETLCAMNVERVHFHHLLDHASVVTSLPKVMKVPFDVTIHDYFAICPRIHLADGGGRYCGEPDEDACNRCIDENGSELGRSVDIASWRIVHREWLASASKVFVPSEDTESRLLRYFPDLDLTVRPHETASSQEWSPPRSSRASGRRRIAVLGSIDLHKGSAILEAAARDAEQRGLGLDFVVIGSTDRDGELSRLKNCSISGPYAADDLPRLLRKANCEIVFFPAMIPETFSFTLTEAMAAGLYCVAFSIGAQAERIEDFGRGHLLPIDSDAAEINDALLSVKIQPTNAPRVFGTRYESVLRDYYGVADFDDSSTSV